MFDIKLKQAMNRCNLSITQLSTMTGIGIRTLYEYKQKYPHISQSLKKGKEVVDIQVENALLKRSLGYEYTERTKERILQHMVRLKFELLMVQQLK